MGKHQIDLIVIDWDGTGKPDVGVTGAWDEGSYFGLTNLVTTLKSSNNYPPLILCTGRPHNYVVCAIQSIGAYWEGFPSICENGGTFYDPMTKETMFHPKLLKPGTDELSVTWRDFITALENDVKYFTSRTNGKFELGRAATVTIRPPQGTTIQEYFQQVCGFLSMYKSSIEITHSSSAVDIMPEGVTKGTALRHLADSLAISLEHVLFIGDSRNDISAFNVAGIKAAPANATDEIKDLVLASENGYVADKKTSLGVCVIVYHYLGL
ncbi:hypothetical protein CL622_00685 [archaeon]|nr:hypothetical protein [archaeon]|tara:strand:- start:3053 stop:3853 length:801 start_codon:yes stop_codon:yes gene_type:complete